MRGGGAQVCMPGSSNNNNKQGEMATIAGRN